MLYKDEYSGLNNGELIKAGGIPEEMYKKTDGEYTGTYRITNPFGGTFAVAAGTGQNSQKAGLKNAFLISTGGIPHAACVEMLTVDWGGDKDGLIGIKVNKQSWRSDAAPAEVTDGNIANRGDITKWDGTQYFGSVYSKKYGVVLPMDMVNEVCGDKTTITYKFK